MFSREQMQRAIEDALKQMEGVALELYRRGREEAREELAEANARRGDLRTALQWANEERDRLREQLAAKHSECPDCADYAARSGRFAEQADQLMRERDEARAEVERLRKADDESAMVTLRLSRELHEARAEVARLRAGKHTRDCRKQSAYNVTCVCGADEANRAEVERLMHQLADATNETTRVRLEAKREIEALTDERDELLVRVANQDAELRATREAYSGARAEVERLKLSARLWADDIDAVSNAYRRGAEAMREACIAWARAPEIDWEALPDVLEEMPIPEEP
jgi:hypothetical protein